MRVNLKGNNSRRKRLADGTWKTYYWLGKGGPPVKGKYGSLEFIASYNEAVAAKVAHPSTQLQSINKAAFETHVSKSTRKEQPTSAR